MLLLGASIVDRKFGVLLAVLRIICCQTGHFPSVMRLPLLELFGFMTATALTHQGNQKI